MDFIDELRNLDDYEEVDSPEKGYNQVTFEKGVDQESDHLFIIRYTSYANQTLVTVKMIFDVEDSTYLFSTEEISSIEELREFEENAKRLMLRLVNENE